MRGSIFFCSSAVYFKITTYIFRQTKVKNLAGVAGVKLEYINSLIDWYNRQGKKTKEISAVSDNGVSLSSKKNAKSTSKA